MKQITHGQIFKALEQWAPTDLAYDWDNVGLQVGTAEDKTKKVLVTLDVIESVVDEAIEQEVNLILAHHPLIFKPLKQINFQTVKGKVIKKLIEHNITVYASHTNLDVAEGGVNDLLSEALKVNHTKPLVDIRTEEFLKLIVFVPETYAGQVREALGDSGAGYIGNYSHCTFQTSGQGTFMPMEGTNPYIGGKNKLEIVNEIKIETIIKEKEYKRVLSAMKEAHPYEEVAYDLYPLKHIGNSIGLGRIGTLERPVKVQELCNQIKKAYQINHLRVAGNQDKMVKSVAIIGGSGEKYLYHAKKMGADAFITGDVTFHMAQDAQEMGLTIIDAGHYIEKIMKQATKEFLLKKLPDLPIIESKVNTDPFQFV